MEVEEVKKSAPTALKKEVEEEEEGEEVILIMADVVEEIEGKVEDVLPL